MAKGRKNGLYSGISEELSALMRTGWADTERHDLEHRFNQQQSELAALLTPGGAAPDATAQGDSTSDPDVADVLRQPLESLYEPGKAAIPTWDAGTPAHLSTDKHNELVLPEGRKP